ncbi:MAG: Zn-ribbon domain-containing OB-fold protein [Acidimicrobiia bacterium]
MPHETADVLVRPLPEPNALTQPFWEAAARHMLVRPVCGRCARSFFTPQVACPHCGSEDWEYRESSGRGLVYSMTTIYRPPLPAFAAPYTLAIVDLEEGWSMLSRVVGCAAEDVHIGMRVQVTWEDAAPGVALPNFKPEGAS